MSAPPTMPRCGYPRRQAPVIGQSTDARDDHRRTLDWLNERTDTGVDFFGVEVSVVQIGETGPRAPVF